MTRNGKIARLQQRNIREELNRRPDNYHQARERGPEEPETCPEVRKINES